MAYRREKGFHLGATSQKILLLLLGGFLLGLNTRPDHHMKIIKAIGKGWKEIDKENLRRTIKRLYYSRLIKATRNNDGTYTLVLTQEGKEKILRYNIETIKIKDMNKWDKKWRIVLFDIPEKSRAIRDALRRALLRTGFFEYQKSVFIYPFDCRDEIDFIIEFFHAREYTRFVIADSLDNELHLKKHFELE